MMRLLVSVICCSAAWTETDATRELRDDICDAFGGMSDKEVCAYLDIPASHLSSMRSGESAGPGILRWAHMPLKFWLRFLYLRGRRIGATVLEDSRLGTLAETLLQLVERKPLKADPYANTEERVA